MNSRLVPFLRNLINKFVFDVLVHSSQTKWLKIFSKKKLCVSVSQESLVHPEIAPSAVILSHSSCTSITSDNNMGNCLKSASEDDNISFLRENIETTPRESIDQVSDFLRMFLNIHFFGCILTRPFLFFVIYRYLLSQGIIFSL